MNLGVSYRQISDSLVKLGTYLDSKRIPVKVVQEAIKDNAWFSAYYIQNSLQSIQSWLRPEVLEPFFAEYRPPSKRKKTVGLITAGNIPLVGFHDVLTCVASGHYLQLKCSRQDQVLMRWLIQVWQKFLPGLDDQLRFVDRLSQPDFVIATGSNNTARYIEAQFQKVPLLVRKNRFSVAILDKQLSGDQLMALCKDVFLYNGMGCRNVSIFLLRPGFNLSAWRETVKEYQKEYLNPLYLERVLFEKINGQLLKRSYVEEEIILMKYQQDFRYVPMGVLDLIQLEGKRQEKRLLSQNQHLIQCVVGKDTAYGQTQVPKLYDFADGVDTMKLLTSLSG